MTSEPEPTDAEQQEQMRQYVEQLRAADPAEIVAQAFTMLGTGAEVKIGRPDARVLIDALGGLVGGAEGRVPPQLLDGMRNGLTQLQQAQVAAEREQSEPAPPASGAGRPAAADGAAGGPAAGGQAPSSGGTAQDDESMTDRLWIPGRGGQPPSP
jgi:hypothetical protein